jgi:hypothetical protein
MANAIYAKGLEGFLGGTNDWDTNNIKVALIDEADDTIDLAVDDNWDDRAAPARVAISGNLASKTITDGVADAADVVFTTVTGDPSESLDVYEDSGTESTSSMLANIDTATGLPVTPNGANINVVWDNGANRIFKL